MPDYDFLGVMPFIATALCAFAFGAGWLLAKILKAGPAEQHSLMFGLGMNNNGAGLVLASLALADHPRAICRRQSDLRLGIQPKSFMNRGCGGR